MAGYKQINPHGGNTFSSTNQPENRGRKKNIYTVLKEKGYSKDDIRTTFSEIAWYTSSELAEVIKDEEKPIIVKIVAKAFQKALKDGNYSVIQSIIEQFMGRPVSSIELASKIDAVPDLANATWRIAAKTEEE